MVVLWGAEDPAEAEARTAGWPPGHLVDLPGRGTTFVRRSPDAVAGTVPLLLLHGWTVDADVNWGPTYARLAAAHPVIALDHRGHGRGIRSRRPFRMVDCADDAAALLDVLGIERAVAVGYSMGGAVAQLLARRHPDRTAGLVLAATADGFSAGTAAARQRFAMLGGAAVAARLAPGAVHRALVQRVLEQRTRSYEEHVLTEMLRNDWRIVLEAGHALGTYRSTPWLGQLDVPAAVVLTTRDTVVPPDRQRRMAALVRGATVHPLDTDHDGCVRQPEAFARAILDAAASVLSRAEGCG